jgi:hypothetical protein
LDESLPEGGKYALFGEIREDLLDLTDLGDLGKGGSESVGDGSLSYVFWKLTGRRSLSLEVDALRLVTAARASSSWTDTSGVLTGESGNGTTRAAGGSGGGGLDGAFSFVAS